MSIAMTFILFLAKGIENLLAPAPKSATNPVLLY
jgi:hypothetical protein